VNDNKFELYLEVTGWFYFNPGSNSFSVFNQENAELNEREKTDYDFYQQKIDKK
jgi:hypothetical protein